MTWTAVPALETQGSTAKGALSLWEEDRSIHIAEAYVIA
jgi:hypothetical protein